MNQYAGITDIFPPSGIRAMFVLAENYPGYINLCNGEPNFETPQNIKDRACEAIQQGFTRYVPAQGTPAFRKAVADKYTRQLGFTHSPEEVTACLGGVEGIWLALMTIQNPGDEIIIPDPSYTCYEGQVLALGGKPVRVPLYEENGFALEADALEAAITPRTKAVILNYPNNPNGAVLTREAAEKLADVIERHGIYVISDEVYEMLVFDGRKHLSFREIERIREKVIVVNSLSKTYAMTGWRVGYIVAERGLVSHAALLQQAVASCLPSFVIEAATEALTGPQTQVDAMVKEYGERREIMLEGLSRIPKFKTFPTEGSFCTFINIKELGVPSQQFAEDLIREAGVLTCGGNVFGKMGEGYLRLCFANSKEAIREGVKRIDQYVRSIV